MSYAFKFIRLALLWNLRYALYAPNIVTYGTCSLYCDLHTVKSALRVPSNVSYCTVKFALRVKGFQ